LMNFRQVARVCRNVRMKLPRKTWAMKKGGKLARGRKGK